MLGTNGIHLSGFRQQNYQRSACVYITAGYSIAFKLKRHMISSEKGIKRMKKNSNRRRKNKQKQNTYQAKRVLHILHASIKLAVESATGCVESPAQRADMLWISIRVGSLITRQGQFLQLGADFA